ncbi:EAL domain-containing protein [Breznakiella homolactica]|uniref:EAL domain-containing protein n=1 Tax=Breznakiella homolactica TaxID=2798577 RepID=A0A7T7XJ76_9SPIR|nr:EAL domain-containing protein [Breznakiella homolactica]QQO07419.1 EAL domain-containing protein [Breznakiella homolactica]
MSKALVDFNDVIDLTLLQTVQDIFSALIKAPVFVLDADDHEVTKGAVPSRMHDVLENQDFQKLYIDFKQNTMQVVRTSLGSCIKKHAVTDLADICIPIINKNVYTGCWYISQVKTETTNTDAILEHKDVLGTAYTDIWEEIKTAPTVTESEIQTIYNSLNIISNVLIRARNKSKDLEHKNRSLNMLSTHLKSTIETMNNFIDISGVGIYLVDFNTYEMLLCNKYFAESVDSTVDDLKGATCYKLLGFNEPCPFCPKEKLLMDTSEMTKNLDWELKLSNSDKWLQVNSRVLHWVDGRLCHIVSFYDITERKQLQDKLSYTAYYDQRMKIPNGFFLARDIKNYISKNSFLICFDLNELRKINEAYNREAGDILLDEIKNWIFRLPYYGINLYRIESDGFAVFLQDYSEPEIIKIARIIWERFNNPWEIWMGSTTHTVFIGITMGIIPCRQEFKDFDELLTTVERVIDMARKKDGILIYNDEANAAFNEHLRLELSLKNSVLDNMQGFSVYYQPIADPVTGTWTSMESLCRWVSPEFGPVSPAVFIPEAEKLGLVGMIDQWVLEEAIKNTKNWGLDTLDRFILDVNLSPIQLNDYDLCDKVVALLRKYNYPPEKLSLEITESAEVNFNERTIAILDSFRQAGISLSLDDFGTGYASFSKLNTLPVNTIKLDQSFVKNVENDEYLRHVIRVMVDFAHGAGFKVIAEGIENTNQMQILLENEVDFFQGFLFSKPLPAVELQALLGNFSNSVNVFPVKTYDPINLDNLNKPGGGYALPSNFYKLINHAMSVLNSAEDVPDAISQVLGLIGEKLRISHAMVFRFNQEGEENDVYEWYAEGIPLKTESVLDEKLNFIFMELLISNGIILASDMSLLDPEIQESLKFFDVNALIALPFWENNRISGFFLISERIRKYREWKPEEVQLLYHIAVLIAGTIKRSSLRKEIVRTNEILEIILNQLDTLVYVSDIEDHRILFMNDMMKEYYHAENPANEPCHSVFHGRKEKCASCHEDELVDGGSDKVVVNESFDENTGRYFRVYDSIIPWQGKKAHLRYSMDITQMRQYQDKLNLFASMDMFASALNKSTLSEMINSLCYKAEKSNIIVSICYVELDKLDQIRKDRGNPIGDDYLSGTVSTLMNTFRSYDIIGRYGERDFVIALPSCTNIQSEYKIQQALNNLKAKGKKEEWPFDPAFSYGIAMNTELPYSDQDGSYSEKIIELALNKIREKKNNRKNVLS